MPFLSLPSPTVSKSYILQRKNQSLGLSHTHQERTHHYVLVFQNSIMARKVHYNMHPEPILRIERNDYMDVTFEINQGLADLGYNEVRGKVSIDVASQLYIPKSIEPRGISNPMNDGGFHLKSIPLENMYMLPFENNVGVIIPYDLTWEDKKQIVLTCKVIDPVDSTFHFYKNLPKSLE
jgi:hypothetical protein